MNAIYSKISKISVFVLAAAMLFFGIAFRIGPHIDYSHAIDANLSSYYFGKFNRLMESGQLGPKDIWQFAPGTNPENVPPGLSYFAGAVYLIAKAIFPGVLPIQVANIFPVIVYVLFALSAFIIFAFLEKSMLAGITVLAAITFSRIFASHTEYSYFAQETLGAFFLFLAAYFLTRVSRSSAYFLAAVLSTAFLILTWQQFPLFYFAAGALILAALMQARFLWVFKAISALILAAVISALAVRFLIGTEYSVLGMIKEIVLGAWLLRFQDPDFLSAMVNPDWFGPAPMDFFRWYGPLTALLVPAGIAASFVRIQSIRHLGALVFGAVGLLLFFQFRKEKIFAFALMLPVIAAAVEVFSYGVFQFGREAFSKIRRIFVYRRRLVLSAAFAGLAAAFFIFIWPAVFYRLWPPPSPVPEVSFQKTENPDGTIDVYVRLTNRGGITYSEPGILWNLNTGLHVEVENADILEFESKSMPAVREWYYYHVYPYIRLGDTQFVETRYKQLKNGEWGDARLKIRPIAEQVKIYSRGWLTDKPCTEEHVKKRLAGLIPSADIGDDLEKCIIRFPRYGDENYPYCPIDIAGRKRAAGAGAGDSELKKLPCAVEKL